MTRKGYILLLMTAFLVIITPFISAINVTDRMVSYYSMDQADGNNIYSDFYNLTIDGATHKTAGAKSGGGAYYFDGTNDIMYNSSYPFMYNFSVSLWIRANDTSSQQGVIELSQNPVTRIYIVTNTITFAVGSDTIATGFTDTTSYHHLVGTANETHISFYIDNSLIGVTDYSGNLTAGTFQLGNYVGAFTRWYDGMVDEVGYWNKTLSAEEINVIYNTEYPFLTTPIIVSSRISPINPLNNDDLSGYCNSTDPDNSTVAYFYKWYKDDVLYKEGYYNVSGWTYQETANSNASTNYYSFSNYSKPGNAVSMTWQYKWASDIIVSPVSRNISLPSNCFQDDVALRMFSLVYNGSDVGGGWYDPRIIINSSCFTGSSWVDTGAGSIDTYGVASPPGITFSDPNNPTNINDDDYSSYAVFDNRSMAWYDTFSNGGVTMYPGIYEEGVFWGLAILPSIEININNVSYTETSIGDEWIFSCLSSDGSSNSTWLNSSKVLLAGKVNITFKDEADDHVINDRTITLEAIADDYSDILTTSNGYLNLTFNSSNTLTFRYSASDYTTRFYYYNPPEDFLMDNITLYMVNNTIYNNVTVTIIDQNGDAVEGAVVKALKYNITSNSYVLQESTSTNFEGKTYMTLTIGDEYYKFIISYDGETVKTTNPFIIQSDDLTIQVIIGDLSGEELFEWLSIDYELTFNTATNNFRFTFNDATNNISGGCLRTYELDLGARTLINSTCVSGSAGTILHGVSAINGSFYESKAYYLDLEGEEHYLNSASYEYPDGRHLNLIGVFIQVLLTITFAFLMFWSMELAAIGVPFSLILGRIIGFHTIPWTGLIPLFVVGIIVAIMLGRRK